MCCHREYLHQYRYLKSTNFNKNVIAAMFLHQLCIADVEYVFAAVLQVLFYHVE